MIKGTITKKFGNKLILDKLKISINEGDFVFIKGESGAGKTTLLNILGLLDSDYQGSLVFDFDNQIFDTTKMRNRQLNKFRNEYISFVFQESNLIEYLSVYDNIIMPLKFQHKPIIEAEIDSILEELGITSHKFDQINHLSGGEKQRVAIARALIKKSKIILADEPTGSLDERNTFSVVDLFKEINEKHHITIVVVSHNSSIEHQFDNTILLRNLS